MDNDFYTCEECGFRYELDRAAEVGRAIGSGVTAIVSILTDDTHDLRSRRAPEVWSPLEYGCHLRDVLLVQRERVLAARRTTRPTFEPMGRDERVEHDGYAQQVPGDVARQLSDTAALFVNVLARLDDADWERMVNYSYPQPFERSLRWVAVHTLHEVHHHLMDIDRQLGS